MREFLSQSERPLAPVDGMVGKAQKPPGESCIGETHDARINAVGIGMRSQQLRIVKCCPFLQFGAGESNLSEPEQGDPKGPVGLHEEGLIAQAPRIPVTVTRATGLVLVAAGAALTLKR